VHQVRRLLARGGPGLAGNFRPGVLAQALEETLESLTAGAEGAADLDRLQADAAEAALGPAVERCDVGGLAGPSAGEEARRLAQGEGSFPPEVDSHWSCPSDAPSRAESECPRGVSTRARGEGNHPSPGCRE